MRGIPICLGLNDYLTLHQYSGICIPAEPPNQFIIQFCHREGRNENRQFHF